MARKSSTLGQRKAWDILRLTLLWDRKGGLIKNQLIVSLNVVQRSIKKLGRQSTSRGALIYGDRELSFDETPPRHVKMCRRNSSSMRFKMPNIPCIKPQVDFDYEFESGDDVWGEEEEEEEEEGCEYGATYDNEEEDDEGIDLKAEKFIANQYEQLKLQRQISYLRFINEDNQLL